MRSPVAPGNKPLPEPFLVVLVLAAVWAINFLVILPQLNPAFPDLLPSAVTFLSKILFGVAAAAVLQIEQRRPLRSPRG